ncbi:UNVERIFIED_CONTAM: hypothetical protein PYX00_007754 [Menopon gallinae]|uniref:Uncharacterized protein n=1 Tax=Menopon gallinae TaxID=328185 RepID=A0AAW2HL54_9NEOP
MVLSCSSSLRFGLFLASINAIAVGGGDYDFQRSLPVLVVWAVQGKDVELPCDVTPDGDDQVSMVLWFKDNVGIPVYR